MDVGLQGLGFFKYDGTTGGELCVRLDSKQSGWILRPGPLGRNQLSVIFDISELVYEYWKGSTGGVSEYLEMSVSTWRCQ